VRWNVSIAHAGDRVVVGASDAGPVGVDVEPVAAVEFGGFDDVALTVAERARVAGLDPGLRAAARAQLWVDKEARLKATGEGLRVDPADEDGSRWVGGLWPLDVGAGYVAAVATTSAGAALHVALCSELSPDRSAPRVAAGQVTPIREG
jgi:hypothetical protein